jgi:hypothetical protein
VLAPKYPAEATATADADADADTAASGAAPAGAEAALLVPAERPANAFVDPSLAAWKVGNTSLAPLSLVLSLTSFLWFRRTV